MKRSVLLTAACLLLLTTTAVHGGPAVGLQGANTFSGLSYRFRDLEQHAFAPQVYGRASLSPNYVDVALGLRGLYSLGKLGPVQRYTGIGGGYEYWTHPHEGAVQSFSAHAFVGLEIPIRPIPVVPIKLSVELTLNGAITRREWTAGTGIGAGIHYQF